MFNKLLANSGLPIIWNCTPLFLGGKEKTIYILGCINIRVSFLLTRSRVYFGRFEKESISCWNDIAKKRKAFKLELRF